MKHLRVISFILLFVLLLTGCASGMSEKTEKDASSKKLRMNVKIGKKKYTATLYDTKAAKKIYKKLPEKNEMLELNGNEKYKYLKFKLPKKERKVRRIKKGDIMLYGNDCLVIFYKSFKTSYKYTRIGRLDKTGGLAKAAGKGGVKVRFSKRK